MKQLSMFASLPAHDGVVLREERAKDAGIARAEAANYRNIDLAREEAKKLGKSGRVITADDVRTALLERFPDFEFGNWMGAVFSTGWRHVGWTRSESAGRHRSALRTWALKESKA